jgi:hypothetical protein
MLLIYNNHHDITEILLKKDGLSIIILSNALALYSKKVFFLVLVKHGTQTDYCHIIWLPQTVIIYDITQGYSKIFGTSFQLPWYYK